MRIALAVLLIILQAYILGSISFAIIVSKSLKHEDIRDYGSKNAGLTNMLRTYGKGPALLTLLGDFTKGIVAVFLGGVILSYLGAVPDDYAVLGRYIAGIFVIVGHIYPVFFHFKGGKGVLTSAGVVLFIDWRLFLICISFFIIVVAITRYVSLGSIIAMLSLPVVSIIINIFTGERPLFIVLAAVFAALIAGLSIYMHKENILRLRGGTERKLGEKKE